MHFVHPRALSLPDGAGSFTLDATTMHNGEPPLRACFPCFSRSRWGLALLGLSLLVTAGAGVGCHGPAGPDPMPEPKTAHVPRLTNTVVIDGRLDEGAWRRATRLKGFVQHDTMAHPRVQTEVLVWYDDNALYLGWRCQDPDIQATLKARDSKFWEEEVVEFFVTPGPLEHYFELQWNPLGGTFDATITNQLLLNGRSQKFDGDWSFTAKGMTWAVQVDGTVQNSADRDRGWTVEVRIPFADLSQPTPQPGDVWRANFYRFNRDTGKPAELLSWSPTIWPGFHQPTRFGRLVFDAPH